MAEDPDEVRGSAGGPDGAHPQVSAGAPVRHGCPHLYHPIAQEMDPHSQGRLNSNQTQFPVLSNRPPHFGPLAERGYR